ncbi:Hypothetical predicted protein [Olea europaea subsp. europaea]|uniref:DUF4378 domain-containing protein n=1 Tax=Olea europaea subsp. europaea TaxID=158383 RepID=A0A8S0U471_OLEEU|nr:Hypothetical predicted protein [Olea europaea subsp. europaea]
MARKQPLLHELLKEEQEPFHLNTYIADRCSQLRKSSLQIKKRKPIIHTSPTDLKRSSFCKNACLFSFQKSLDFRKSPFQSPCKSPNRAVFLHIPARTAALLVEAAVRIQTKQSKRKTQIKNVGFGLFGTAFKMLKDRTKNKRRMLGVCDNQVEISRKNETKIDEKMDMDIRFSSCDNWSSSNEEKSMDLETSTSSCSDCVAKGRANINGDFASCENRFCSSPFRFSLQKSPSSSGCPTPDFSSSEASPSRRSKGEKANCGTKCSEEILEEEEEEEEEKEKDHFSPVSVLDPPFEEDDGQERANVDEDGYDLECSYANVQRAKQQLLHRLRRFEELAELYTIELERKLLEESDDDDQVEKEEYEDDEHFAMYREHIIDTFASEVLTISRLQKTQKIPTDMKRLVLNLIVEQKSERNCSSNGDQVVFDTVDMMIELAFRRESNGWTKFREQEEETAAEIEVGIFGILVEELSEELCY